MRKKLQAINGQRAYFTGCFGRIGKKIDSDGFTDTVLLHDIRDANDEWITDHLWVEFASGFRAIPLRWGVRVAFEAQVRAYLKGRRSLWGHGYTLLQVDYGLVQLTNIRIVSGPEEAEDAALAGTDPASTTDTFKPRRPQRVLEQ